MIADHAAERAQKASIGQLRGRKRRPTGIGRGVSAISAHVPYRGSSAAYPDLISGKVQVLFDNLGAPF